MDISLLASLKGRCRSQKPLYAAVLALAGALSCGAAYSQSPADNSAPDSVIISRDVTVEAGDTLRHIAERELGRRSYAGALADFNRIDVDADLTPGSLIRIPINVPSRGETAVVIFAKGGATVNGNVVEADAPINLGDVISTGRDGYVSLEFSNGSVVNIQPESEAILQQLSCLAVDDSCIIEIETTTGNLTSDVESREDQALEFRVTTPYASAAVRGTEFTISADPAALTVAVTEGTVDIAALGTSAPLDEGFGSVTREGQPPGQPVALLPAPAFRNVPGRVAVGDRVLWWSLTDVDSYAVRLSLDSDGAETLSEAEPNGDSLDITALGDIAPGDYFLAVRGVDENGIPGFSSNTRLVVAGVDNTVAAPEVNVTRTGNDTLVAVVDPAEDATGYEIQISTTEDFSDPLSVDVGRTGSAVFRLDADVIFARARRLLDPTLVSSFGTINVDR